MDSKFLRGSKITKDKFIILKLKFFQASSTLKGTWGICNTTSILISYKIFHILLSITIILWPLSICNLYAVRRPKLKFIGISTLKSNFFRLKNRSLYLLTPFTCNNFSGQYFNLCEHLPWNLFQHTENKAFIKVIFEFFQLRLFKTFDFSVQPHYESKWKIGDWNSLQVRFSILVHSELLHSTESWVLLLWWPQNVIRAHLRKIDVGPSWQ